MQDQPLIRYLDRSTPPHISTLIILSGLAALSMNVFLPSLPGMTAYFQTDYRIMQLSVALYLAVNAAMQIVVGPLSDHYGRRPVLLWGIGLFLLATLGCILSPTAYVFLVFRMAQAVIVTAMVLSRAVVRDIVPDAHAASMIGYVTMGMAIVPMISPAIGGVLETQFDWRANFWLLFILAALTFALTWRDVGETATSSHSSLRDQIRDYPELLQSVRFWGYALTTAFSAGAFFAYLGGAPFVGEQVFGLEPTTLGLFMSTPAIGYVLGNFLSGRFSTRVGVNQMCAIGLGLTSVGVSLLLILFSLGQATPYVFFGFMIFVGLGNGMTIPNGTAGALSVRPQLAGTASGLSGAIMLGGGAALSALSGALLTIETGAFPLLWIMVGTSVAGLISVYAVIRRERAIS